MLKDYLKNVERVLKEENFLLMLFSFILQYSEI